LCGPVCDVQLSLLSFISLHGSCMHVNLSPVLLVHSTDCIGLLLCCDWRADCRMRMCTGGMERLQKFWLAGVCRKNSDRKGDRSLPLEILNFTSAFILLAGGMVFVVLLLIFEHIYFKFLRVNLRKWDHGGCCSLVSLVRSIDAKRCQTLNGFEVLTLCGIRSFFYYYHHIAAVAATRCGQLLQMGLSVCWS